MFVQINNKRIKITSISRYNDEGYSQSTKKFRIALKISNSIGIARKVFGDSAVRQIIGSGLAFNPIRVNIL